MDKMPKLEEFLVKHGGKITFDIQFKRETAKTLVRNQQYTNWNIVNLSESRKMICACISVQSLCIFILLFPVTDSPNGGQNNSSASSGPALDTIELSQEALRLLRLSKIPIAQFAAHLLERSQGRGSESLNKPKTWEQLLEEGREPYRRIKNWLQQEYPIGDLRGKIQGTWIAFEYV